MWKEVITVFIGFLPPSWKKKEYAQ
jgi:hypothetical protein